MFPSDDKPKLMVRFPADLKKWLEEKSQREAASQNTLIVQALRRMQDNEGTAQ